MPIRYHERNASYAPGISTLLSNMESAFSTFTKEMLAFSITHINKRNSELHSGALPFDGVGTSSWLPMYYSVCDCLLKEIGETLESFLGTETAKEARAHIKAGQDDAAKAVKQSISAHKTVWEEMTPKVRAERESQAKNTITRYLGHRVSCPSCGCVALLQGSPAGTPIKSVDSDGIVERQRMLPASLECVACELKIIGYSKLVACGLGDAFTSVSTYSPIEYFNIDIANEYESMMGDDNNEPW